MLQLFDGAYRPAVAFLWLFVTAWLAAGPAAAQEGAPPLASVRHWLLLLNNDLEPATVEKIAASAHDMVVVDDLASMPSHAREQMRGIVETLRRKPDGSRRLVIAYLNVGQAESYRRYWRKSWRVGAPAWIVGKDPDGWEGNYPVAYWHAEWQRIIVGEDGVLAGIQDAGFDGIYLDWIGGFEDEAVQAAAARDDVDAKAEMVRWVNAVSAAAKAQDPAFLIIGQNATPLLLDDAYLAALDGVAHEDIWYTGADGGPDGDCPVPRTADEVGSKAFLARLPRACRKAYAQDRANAMRYPGESAIVPALLRAREQGKTIFTVDYALRPANVTWVTAQSRSFGFVPFVGARPLSTLVPPR